MKTLTDRYETPYTAAHGRTARYCGDTLYEVRRNDDRQCIVALPSGFDLPEDINWKTRDHWRGVHHYTGREYPGRMRRHTAAELLEVVRVNSPDYVVVFSTMGDLSDLPPLPDPGPEPLWHQKNLEEYLGRRYLDLPEDQWEAVAALDYVDKDYLSRVYELTRSSWNSPATLDKADALSFILENRPFPAEAEEESAEEDYDDMDDEEWEDDEH